MEELIRDYGLYAIFFLTMIEGDLTLLLAGVLARTNNGFSFSEAVAAGTLGGFVGDCVSYGIGRYFRQHAVKLKFYELSQHRLERISKRFGLFTIFAVKYIYGLRTMSAVFWGVTNFGFPRFAVCTFFSCLLWVLSLCGLGFFFTLSVQTLLGHVRKYEMLLLVAAIFIVVALLVKKYHLTEKALEEE